MARQLDEERQRIREATKKEDDERHRLKLAEKDKAIEGMAKQVDELRRKIDQGFQQLQGEVLEKDVIAVLKDEFRDDVSRMYRRDEPAATSCRRSNSPTAPIAGR